MQFKEVYVTDAGQIMLARAVANKERINWSTANTIKLANINTETEETIRGWEDFPDNTWTSGGCTGQVTSSIADDNKVTLHCELTNGTVGTRVFGVGIYAKIENGTEKLAIIARTADITAVYITGRGTIVKLYIDVTVNLTDYVATAVTVDASNYAQAGALAATNEAIENLHERVVTTHSVGDKETGEAQTIRGEKKFLNDCYFANLKPVRTDKILIGGYNNTIDRSEYINGLVLLLNINEQESAALYDAIVSTDFRESSYIITVPAYNITTENVELVASDLTSLGFYATAETKIGDLGSNESPFRSAYFNEGVNIIDESGVGKELCISRSTVNNDVCIRGKQDGAAENYIEMRAKTQGGDMGPYIRVNVNRTTNDYKSSIILNAQKFSGSGDYGATLRLYNQIVDGANVSSISGSTSSFKLTNDNGTPYLTATPDGVTAPKYNGLVESLCQDAIGGLFRLNLTIKNTLNDTSIINWKKGHEIYKGYVNTLAVISEINGGSETETAHYKLITPTGSVNFTANQEKTIEVWAIRVA